MPLYEYRCLNCGNKFEKLALFSAADEIKCPKCKAVAKKVMGTIAYFSFEGTLA